MTTTRIIDTPWRTTAKAATLAAAGVETVIRYYNFANSSTLPEKALTLAEAQVLCGAGLRLGVVFQQRQNQTDDFSRAKGVAAGRRAYRLATDEIGQPVGSGIYFSVDYDADTAAVKASIAPFFEGVKAGMDAERGDEPGFRIGAYGSGLVCRSLSDAGLIDLSWLAMSRGFRGTREAIAAGAYHLNQVPPARSLCGLDVDCDEDNPAKPDFGAFTIAGEAVPAAGPGPAAAYCVTARSGLRLRAGPGTGFDIVGSLPYGGMVYVVAHRDGWAKIDREGDGAVDGFAFAEFLEPA